MNGADYRRRTRAELYMIWAVLAALVAVVSAMAVGYDKRMSRIEENVGIYAPERTPK